MYFRTTLKYTTTERFDLQNALFIIIHVFGEVNH